VFARTRVVFWIRHVLLLSSLSTLLAYFVERIIEDQEIIRSPSARGVYEGYVMDYQLIYEADSIKTREIKAQDCDRVKL
jgi:hypothetical protein